MPNSETNGARSEISRSPNSEERSCSEGGDAEISRREIAQPIEVAPLSEQKPKKSHFLPLFATFFCLLALLIFLLVNHTAVLDTFKGIGYNPTPDMLAVKTSLGLTSDGERIFNATHPILASRDDFNDSCESHDEDISVLGCYTGDRIYVFNVDDTSLPGIRESTAAHEFLHAVWNRLPGVEKNTLVPLLEEIYTKNDDLKKTVDSYAESERLDELYVRVGTQIADLPEALEAHYAKYFSNQDSIAAFYASYIAPFDALRSEIETLKSELESLEKEIKEKSAALDEKIARFDSSVAEFNHCAETAGCFASDFAFSSRRAELVLEQQSLSVANKELNALIDSYNQKAESYNSSVVRSTALQNLINSNSPEPATEIKE